MGRSALATVRLSGSTDRVLGSVVVPMHPGPWRSGRTRRVRLVDAQGVFDDGVAVWARGPRSYTGESTLEVHLHGNPLLVDRLLRACVDAGARPAQPGEFTRRAVMRGRLSLVEAEGVDQVIRAATSEGVAVARRALDGTLGQHIGALRDAVLDATAELEARLDLPGDDLVLRDDAQLLDDLKATMVRSRQLAETHTAGRRRVEGARVALVGPVNAGKSSLFNGLLGQQRALVHASPGTTRDVVEARCVLGAIEVTLLDTAGRRETDDPIEAAGLALADALVADADLLVVVLRASADGPTAEEHEVLAATEGRARVLVYNGIDRPDVAPGPPGSVSTSALAGTGVPALAHAIGQSLVGSVGPDTLQIASVRQRDLLLAMANCVDDALEAFEVAGIAAAADALTDAVGQVDALTGADPREAVLDRVFVRFCIGK